MATDLSVINAALTRTGNNPVTSLTAGSVAAIIANQNYENLVKAELANHPWKRASKIAQLARLDPDVEGKPSEPWTAAYELPADLVDIRTVTVVGVPIDYEVQGETILCNADASDAVILHYVWRVGETSWPAWFREGVIRRCEAIFLRGIGERFREAEARDSAAEEQFAKARNRDSQSQTPRDPVSSPTLAARRGTLAIGR